MSKTATKLNKEDTLVENAARYLADRAYRNVLGKSQTLKLRQISKSIDVEGATPRLLRHVMAESDRFETVDRRWAASTRLGDNRRPLERVITEIIQSAGVPVSVETLAGELAQVYGRAVEYYEEALPRVLADQEKFFSAGDGAYGLESWLLMPTSEDEHDIIFDNFLSEEQVEEFTAMCPKATWEPGTEAETAAKVIKGCKRAVPMRILALFAWREVGEDFEPGDFYSKIVRDERMLVLSDQRVYPAEEVKDFEKALGKMAQEIAKLPMEANEEEAEGPITVTDTDREEIVALILEKDSATVEELLETVLEVTADEATYAGALASLTDSLKDEERVMWLGGERWGKVEVFPEEVKVMPESLVVPPTVPFETPEGEVFDQELEQDGFDSVLKSAVFDPLAQDVTDEDPDRTNYQPNGDSQRCVLKYHHKVEGTFPLCQINPDFFGSEPEIIPIVLTDEGKRKNVYVNNTTRLIYGLADFYKDITEISGAVFQIAKTQKPGEYHFIRDGEVDEQLVVDTGRSLEVLEIKAKFESQDMPLYDVIIQILEQRKQGATFAQLVNEVNIVKRCSRLVVASILSSYHAFHTRGKSKLWQFDAKKASQGFNKSKRKYIKKEQ